MKNKIIDKHNFDLNYKICYEKEFKCFIGKLLLEN